MDTSETYIKMCEKAGEIQKLWKPNEEFDLAYCEYCHKCHRILGEHKDSYIWLPRQDQLQEMVSPNKERLAGLITAFDVFLYNEGERLPEGENHLNSIETHYTSMEQLWLAFIMKEKYNKVWNNGDWVEAK